MASIYVRAKNAEGKWRYSRVKIGKGYKTSHLRPPFFIRPVRDGKQIWQALEATSFAEAEAEAERLEVDVKVVRADDPNRVTIAAAVDKFVAHATATKKHKTVIGYKLNLAQFSESTYNQGLKYLDQVTGEVIRKFRDFLIEKKYDARTQENRVITVLSLLKKNKIQTDFSIKDDLPSYEDEIAVPYPEDQLKKLFAAMVEKETVKDKEYSGKGFGEKIRYQFFLGTGCRDKEVTYASWDDIDFEKKTYHVRGKSGTPFTPKNWESRIIPLPTRLVEVLRLRKRNAPDPRWVFVNEDGRAENHFLRKLKRIAKRAGLNCGHCKTRMKIGKYAQDKYEVEVSCKTHPVCEDFILHRFRKTCATAWVEDGISITNIQRYLGHKSLETTQIYLGATDSPEVRSKIDAAYQEY